MTNPIGDIEKANVLLITGSNTTENHPVLSSYVKRAVTQKGAKLIVADPRRIPIVDFAAVWMRQKLGTDVASINGLMHVIIKEKLFDEAYVTSRTVGLEDIKKTVEKYTPEFVEGITGIPRDDLIKAARLYASAKAASILYAMGITQHICGTDNVKSLANLAMLCGLGQYLETSSVIPAGTGSAVLAVVNALGTLLTITGLRRVLGGQ